MKRVLLAAAFVCVSTSAFAAETMIKNHSGIDIDHLYVSATGKNTFSADLMVGSPAGSLDNGKSYSLSGLVDGTYDFKVADDDDGKNCVMPSIKVKTGKAINLTQKIGASCK